MRKVTNDHRTRVTKMLIRRALTGLLAQKPIQSISVKELCEAAGINRGTFYSHYTDIYKLQKSIEDEMYEDFKAALIPCEKREDDERTSKRVFEDVFSCLKENSDLCAVTLGEYGEKNFAYRLIDLGKEFCLSLYESVYPSVSRSKLEYVYSFISTGCVGLLRKWLNEGMKESSQEIAEIAYNMSLTGISSLAY